MRSTFVDLQERAEELTELIAGLDELLKDPPAGSLRVSSKAGKPQYYIRSKPSDRLGKYVRKADIPRAAALAQRDYDLAVRDAAEGERTAIDSLLSIRGKGTAEDIYDGLILPRKQLVTPRFMSDEEFAAKWLAEPYKPKGFKEGDPVFNSSDGTRVRSKSEALIKDRLDKYMVPTKFECPVRLWNGKTIHPDFTLLNKRFRIVYIWEHLGKADDPGYMNYNTGRINDLIRSGFVPGVNMILTFETGTNPLDMNVVELMIKHFLI